MSVTDHNGVKIHLTRGGCDIFWEVVHETLRP